MLATHLCCVSPWKCAAIALAFFATVSPGVTRTETPTAKSNYERPFEPPTRSTLVPLPPGAVEPQGWLREWCITARDGYTGHMNDVDPAFRQAWAADYKMTGKKLCRWDEGGWPYEGGGYWFEGLVKLGYVLHDQSLIDQAKARLGVVIDHQNPKGILFMWWLDKKKPEDVRAVRGDTSYGQGASGAEETEWPMWANGLMGRSLVGYYAASGDPRVLKTLENAYSNDRDWLRLGWGMSNPWPAFETYTWTGNKEIKAALDALFAKGGLNQKDASWNRYRQPPSEKPGAEKPDHGVHFCESTAPWALGYLWTGDRRFLDAALRWHEFVARDSMQPYGVPVFDEFYGPTGAFRGTETCDVGAYIWAQELLLSVSGKGRLADRIERAFFNAVPATVSRDFKTHVYFQSPNRMADKSLPAARQFTFAAKHDPLCCTAVVNRLLPNYVINMWMATRDSGLAATCYGPCKVTALAADRVPVEIVCRTDYPLNETIAIAVTPQREAKFPISLRIPGWCKKPELKVNNTDVKAVTDANGFVRIERPWKPGDRIALRFPMSPCIATGKDENAHGSPYATVSLGPLLFALPIAEGKDLNTPNPAAKWRFALDARTGKPDCAIAVDRGPMPAKWGWPIVSPLKLRLNAARIEWKPTLKQPLPPKPISKTESTETIALVPYGCTKFRVSMFPVTADAIESQNELVARLRKMDAEHNATKEAELARHQAEAAKRGIKVVEPPKASEGWGPERDGLRTRLIPAQKEYAVGQPARFRLEMNNFGEKVRAYDPQSCDVNSPIQVKDPDGKESPYIAGSYQTGGGTCYIEPGETVVLFRGLDVTDQYLLTKPGSYTLRFRGTNVVWHVESTIPPSATVNIEMLPGKLPMPMQIPARLVRVVPNGWHLSLNWRVAEVQNGKIAPPGWTSGSGTYLSLDSDPASGLKVDVVRVPIWVAEHRLAWTGKRPFLVGTKRTQKAVEPGEAAAYLGKGTDGYVYWVLPKEAEKQWPGIRAKLAAALKIETEKPKDRAAK